MDSKYISEGTKGMELIVHCPHCRGVVLRNYKKDYITNEISFKTRCPHCKKDVTVFIKLKNGAVIQIQKEDGLTIIKGVEK